MDQPYIELNNFLKINNIVATGGQAKVLIKSGQVSVNGSVETRTRKKLIVGDKVTYNNQNLLVTDEVVR
jgi:ribosome-associated protein